MKLQENSLRVFFNTKIDEEFIGDIRKFFESKGYKWIGQGMDMIDVVYDVSFEDTSDLPVTDPLNKQEK